MIPLLRVENLIVRFPIGGTLARLTGNASSIEGVADVSFNLMPGETLALIGESGSGKTTLARAIAGLGKDVSGVVEFEGRALQSLDREGRHKMRRDVAMIFQDAVSSLSPRFNVRSLIAEPFHIHGVKCDDLDAEVERLLGLVGLSPAIADRYPHELSGGQARRVGVARAIALSPKLIIADEPTAGLDVSVQSEVLNLLNELRERLNLSVLVITHNLNIVRHIADKMAIMYLGRFVEQGETDAIFHQPKHPYSAALLAANPLINPQERPERLTLKGEVPSILARPSGCELHGRCPFVQDVCVGQVPVYTKDAEGRSYSCHFPLSPAGTTPIN